MGVLNRSWARVDPTCCSQKTWNLRAAGKHSDAGMAANAEPTAPGYAISSPGTPHRITTIPQYAERYETLHGVVHGAPFAGTGDDPATLRREGGCIGCRRAY